MNNIDEPRGAEMAGFDAQEEGQVVIATAKKRATSISLPGHRARYKKHVVYGRDGMSQIDPCMNESGRSL